jgi:hypothetical protein
MPGRTTDDDVADFLSGDDGRESSGDLGPEFYARYDSECAECYDGIYEDDLIRADGKGGYIHAECAETWLSGH